MSKDTATKELTGSAEAYVRTLLLEKLDATIVFHNIGHAEELAEEAQKLSKGSELSTEERTQLLLAAWFLDTGYTEDPKAPYPHSQRIAGAWLKTHSYPHTDAVTQLIAGAQQDAVEELDTLAAYFHDVRYNWLGRKRFERRASLLRLEEEQVRGEAFTHADWEKRMQALLLNRRYLTQAGIEKYQERLDRNLADQRDQTAKAVEKTLRKQTGKNYGRGIDTVYRTSFRNHITLSRIADGKANMMISINTIILSILLAVSGAGISFFEDIIYTSPGFILPIITLILSSLIAVVFAVFSARPKVTEYQIRHRKPEERDPGASLLYFGNFLQLPKQEFVEYMGDVKIDQEALYDDLARDLYDLGGVLQRKYFLLTVSYNIFVGGLALSVVMFLVVYLFSIA